MGLLVLHSTELPPPPSQHAPFDVPSTVDDVILQCLTKHKETRVGSADALDRRLAELQDDLPWTPADAAAWWEQYDFEQAETLEDIDYPSEPVDASPRTVAKAIG